MAKRLHTRALQPAIISSFSVTGEASDLSTIPKACSHVEVYAFMHQWLVGALGPEESAVQYMARLFRGGQVAELTDWIESKFQSKNIIAFATFIPELTAPGDKQQDIDDATDALKLLIDVSRVLQSRGHSIRTIELVSGSRIQGLLQVPPDPHRQARYRAKRFSDEEAIKRLVDRLVPVARYAMEKSPVYLAVELEPGPLFVLSGASTLKQFCRAIEQCKDRSLQHCVGLNLDIPHWSFLARITPNWLESPENEFIFRRIVHAHVCDHHVGHLCDATVGLFNHEDEFSRWFSLLQKMTAKKRPRRFPLFSGFVSCEMEACRDSEMVQACFDKVQVLLGKDCVISKLR